MDQFDENYDESLLNLKELTNEELRAHLDELYAEEQETSYRRRVLHGRIDILRAELVHRIAQRLDLVTLPAVTRPLGRLGRRVDRLARTGATRTTYAGQARS